MDTPLANDTLLPAVGVNRPTDIYYDASHELLYWREAQGSIMRSKLNGSSPQLVGMGAESFAVDPSSENIYWTDSEAGAIVVSRGDGSYRKVIVQIDSPADITLDIEGG